MGKEETYVCLKAKMYEYNWNLSLIQELLLILIP